MYRAPLALMPLLFAARVVGQTPALHTQLAGFRVNATHHGRVDAIGVREYGGIAWRLRTGGAIRSSPTVVAPWLYVGSGDGALYAVNARTGAVRWRHAAGKAITGSPAVTAALTYVTDIAGRLIAVSTATGALRWTASTGTAVPFPWGHESTDYYTSSPAVAQSLVVVGGADGFVYAFDAATGVRRWRVRTEGRVRSSPAIVNGVAVVGSFDGRVYAIELETGRIKWRFESNGASLQSSAFGYDRRSIQASPAIVDGVVYVGGRDGRSYAIDAHTGALKWAVDHDETSWVIGSPAIADSLLVEGSSDARFVHALRLRDGTQVWRRDSPNTVWSSPVVAQGVVYAADGNYDGSGVGRVFALDLSTGAERWTATLPAPVLSSPAIADDMLFVGCDDGSLYALRNAQATLHRTVFWDSLAAPWGLIGGQTRIREFFRARGYQVLDALSLAAWMQQRIADSAPSVVVFSIDHAPRTIAATSSDTVLLRRYLNAGGKIIWPGVPPRYWLPDSTGRRTLTSFGGTGTRAVLGVDFNVDPFDRYSTSPTPLGRTWGFEGWWLGAMASSVDPSVDVLARDERGFAAAWVKRYVGDAGAGFFFMPRANWDEAGLRQLAYVAEHRPR